MKAALRDRYGGPDVVEVRDVDLPIPGGDVVVVRVVAASVNRADLDFLYGVPKVARAGTGLRAPRVKAVGVDVAGVVDTIGAEVTRFKPGDRVFADLYPFAHGSFAEYAAAPERAFAPIPAGLIRGGRHPAAFRSSRCRDSGGGTAEPSGPATGC